MNKAIELTAAKARELSKAPRDCDNKIITIIMKLIMKVCESNSDNNFVIKIEDEKDCFKRSAESVMADKGWLRDFTEEELKILTEFSYERFLNKRVRQKLKDLGYEINVREDFDFSEVISWE